MASGLHDSIRNQSFQFCTHRSCEPQGGNGKRHLLPAIKCAPRNSLCDDFRLGDFVFGDSQLGGFVFGDSQLGDFVFSDFGLDN